MSSLCKLNLSSWANFFDKAEGNRLNWFDSVLGSECTSPLIKLKQASSQVKSSVYIEQESSLLSAYVIIN